MDNSSSPSPPSNTNPNSPFSPFPNLDDDDHLSSMFNTLSLRTSSANPPNFSSPYPQYHSPSNTHLGYGFDESGGEFPGPSRPYIHGNNGYDRFHGGSLYGVNLGFTVEDLQNPDAILDLFVRKALHEAGSREIQGYLNMRDPETTGRIYEKLTQKSPVGAPYFAHLMVSQHGCYVFKKLINVCNPQQLATIVTYITCDNNLFVHITLTKFGSCSVLKLIKILKKSPLVSLLVSNFAAHFERMMTEKFGLYALSECLDELGETQNNILYRLAIRHCFELAQHVQGCISLNAFIEKIRGPCRALLMRRIYDHSVFLSFDASGNYVVQQALAMENPEFTYMLTMKLQGSYASLSRQKGGSHLVERCLKSTAMTTVVEDLIRSRQAASLGEDKYGNYVIQTAYKVSKAVPAVHSELLGCLLPFVSRLRTGYGKNVHHLIVLDRHCL